MKQGQKPNQGPLFFVFEMQNVATELMEKGSSDLVAVQYGAGQGAIVGDGNRRVHGFQKLDA